MDTVTNTDGMVHNWERTGILDGQYVCKQFILKSPSKRE